jgi:hypothetical protein
LVKNLICKKSVSDWLGSPLNGLPQPNRKTKSQAMGLAQYFWEKEVYTEIKQKLLIPNATND